MNTSPKWSTGDPAQSQLRKLRDGGALQHLPRNETATARSEPSAPAPLAPIDFLRGHPAFRQLPANTLEQIRSYVIRKRVQRGALIFAKGDPGSSVMAVLDGSVRISVPTINGHEIVLAQVSRGAVFGELAVIDGQPRSANATAVEDCELMVIERRNFLPFILGYPEMAIKLLELVSARLRQSNEQIEAVMFTGLQVRLARAILKLLNTTECDVGPLRLVITQRELSQMIGVSRESTNKRLRIWEKRGWIRLDQGALTVLNVRALSRIKDEHPPVCSMGMKT
jgi:CRP/FNR family transcriptional regulator, cyclic AMP receptor protein